MATEWARSRCRERLGALAEATADLDTVRREAIGELRRAIGFDRWTILAVDPRSLVTHTGACVIDDITDALPWLNVHDPGLSDVNNITMLARSRDPVGVMSSATGGDPMRSERWRRIYAPRGMGDELRLAAVDKRACWADIHLFRDSDDPPFDADDAQLMRDVSSTLARAMRRGFISALPATPRLRPAETGVFVLGDDLRVRSWTESTREWFAALHPDPAHRPDGLPIDAWGAIGRLLSAERGEVDGLPPRALVRGANGGWAVTEAARLRGADAGVTVSIRAARAEEILSLVSRAHGLTARQCELVALVLEGHDTHAIAHLLAISPYTVQDHLKAVFQKVGVNNRRDLVTGVFALSA